MICYTVIHLQENQTEASDDVAMHSLFGYDYYINHCWRKKNYITQKHCWLCQAVFRPCEVGHIQCVKCSVCIQGVEGGEEKLEWNSNEQNSSFFAGKEYL